MKICAIIPARSGSKGVIQKNIKSLNGIPLMAYSIKVALESKHIERAIVSTDSQEFVQIAKEYGAEVPFLRPAHISQDNSTDFEMIEHALDWLLENENYLPDYIVHLRPTTPLRRVEVVDDAIEKLIETNDATSLRSVHQMSESAYKCMEIDSKVGYLKTVFEGNSFLDETNNARQMFPKTYSANGYVDVLDVKYIQKNRRIHGNKVLPYITPPVIEVDTIDDFKLLQSQLRGL